MQLALKPEICLIAWLLGLPASHQVFIGLIQVAELWIWGIVEVNSVVWIIVIALSQIAVSLIKCSMKQKETALPSH